MLADGVHKKRGRPEDQKDSPEAVTTDNVDHKWKPSLGHPKSGHRQRLWHIVRLCIIVQIDASRGVLIVRPK